jgi:hypothetical protein
VKLATSRPRARPPRKFSKALEKQEGGVSCLGNA